MKKILVAISFVFVTGFASPSQAEPLPELSPPFGGCFDKVTREYCAGMIAPTALSGLRLKDGVVVGGAFPAGGLGYAFHMFYAEWYTVTIGVAVAASASTNTPEIGNYANIAALLGFAKYAFVGTMVNIVADARWWYLLAGVDLLSVVTAQQAAVFRVERARPKEAARIPDAVAPPPEPTRPVSLPPAPLSPDETAP
jgi:hypothetical protein